jgi:hypothetical protein
LKCPMAGLDTVGGETDKLCSSIRLKIGDETDRLSRNVSTELPFYAA